MMYLTTGNLKTVLTLSKQGGGTAAYNNISLGLFLINHVASTSQILEQARRARFLVYLTTGNPKTVLTSSKQGGGTAAYNNISLGLFLINHVAILLSPEMEKRKEDFIEQRGATV